MEGLYLLFFGFARLNFAEFLGLLIQWYFSTSYSTFSLNKSFFVSSCVDQTSKALLKIEKKKKKLAKSLKFTLKIDCQTIAFVHKIIRLWKCKIEFIMQKNLKKWSGFY